MTTYLIVICTLVFLGTTGQARKLPDYVKTCQRNTPQSEQCFADAIIGISKRIGMGIPEMAIPPLEPLVLPRLYVDSGTGGSFAFDIDIKNAELHGPTTLKVKKAKMDLEKDELHFTFHVPVLNVTGHYKSKGKMLVIAIDGEGEIFFSFHQLVLTGVWKGTRQIKKTKEYFNFEPKSFSIETGKGSSGMFGDLFKNNPELTEATNKVFNDNFEIAFEEFKPAIDSALSQVMTSVINGVHGKFSIDTLYPV